MTGISTRISIDTKTGSLKDYVLLMKPRVMLLVVFTALIGLVKAPGDIHPLIATISIVCITLGAGSAAAINMWYDRDIDAMMLRTKTRPIVTGKIEPDDALSFGVIIGFCAVFMMALCVNMLSSFLLLFAILYYVFIYTIWLKRTHLQNVVIGGVAGALPPMIGWATVTGGISSESLILFLIIFLWTPPHSWALALYRLEDYTNSNVPMMPVVRGDTYTKFQILIYALLMFVSSLMPSFMHMSGTVYLIVALISGIIFIYYCLKLFTDNKQHKNAKTLFIYSIFYLFGIFLSLLAPA